MHEEKEGSSRNKGDKQGEKRMPWEKKADSHDLSADETCSRSIWNMTIRYKPTVQWRRAYSPFDHSPVSMETHWGLNRYQVFERWMSNLAHRPWMKAEVSFHPYSPGLSLPFNEVWVVRFQWLRSTFCPDRRLFFPLERPPCLPPIKMRSKQNKIDTRCRNLPSSTAQGCPNFQQEQNGCLIFHLPLTLSCESSPLQPHRFQQSPPEKWPCSNTQPHTITR